MDVRSSLPVSAEYHLNSRTWKPAASKTWRWFDQVGSVM